MATDMNRWYSRLSAELANVSNDKNKRIVIIVFKRLLEMARKDIHFFCDIDENINLNGDINNRIPVHKRNYFV